MLSIDNFLRPSLAYDSHAAHVLPPEKLPPASAERMPLALEYQARHAVLAGFVVGKMLGLKPKRMSTGAPANDDAHAMDAVTGFILPDVLSDNAELMAAVRIRADKSLNHDSWTAFMITEDERSRADGIKPPPLNVQPQINRTWIEGMVKRAEKALGSRVLKQS